MKELDLKKVIKRYNSIMWELCYEHLTIGTTLSEETENWNLRDMVAEADYILSTYYEHGHVNNDLLNEGVETRKAWRRETGRLRRFIEAYEPFIGNMKCSEGHCSRFD